MIFSLFGILQGVVELSLVIGNDVEYGTEADSSKVLLCGLTKIGIVTILVYKKVPERDRDFGLQPQVREYGYYLGGSNKL